MSWPLAAFDTPDGTRDLLRRLAASPLVRQSLPNTAAICAQYFAFKRLPQETMQAFLIRETLGYAEFTEALVRLYEEQNGIKQEDKDFGIPPAYREESWYGDEELRSMG